jgi:hypothetical protein
VSSFRGLTLHTCEPIPLNVLQRTTISRSTHSSQAIQKFSSLMDPPPPIFVTVITTACLYTISWGVQCILRIQNVQYFSKDSFNILRRFTPGSIKCIVPWHFSTTICRYTVSPHVRQGDMRRAAVKLWNKPLRACTLTAVSTDSDTEIMNSYGREDGCLQGCSTL